MVLALSMPLGCFRAGLDAALALKSSPGGHVAPRALEHGTKFFFQAKSAIIRVTFEWQLLVLVGLDGGYSCCWFRCWLHPKMFHLGHGFVHHFKLMNS